MPSLKRLIFKRTLLTLLLSLLLWSALFPAHFSNAQRGRVVELCTNSGMQQIWVNDSRDALAVTANVADDIAASPLLSGHSEPHCAWCVLSIPALVFFALLLFFAPRLQNIIATPRAAPLRLPSMLWRFSCPRAPPIHSRFLV